MESVRLTSSNRLEVVSLFFKNLEFDSLNQLNMFFNKQLNAFKPKLEIYPHAFFVELNLKVDNYHSVMPFSFKTESFKLENKEDVRKYKCIIRERFKLFLKVVEGFSISSDLEFANYVVREFRIVEWVHIRN